jgi:hypothetical protein
MEKLELSAYTNEAGIFHIQNRQRLIEWAKMNPGRQLTVRIDKKGSRRSIQGNRYYWGVVVESVRHGLLNLGYELTKDETHFFLKERFNSVSIENKAGISIDVPGTTTQLTKSEFSDYIEKIARFSAEFLNTVIPSANESLEMKFE